MTTVLAAQLTGADVRTLILAALVLAVAMTAAVGDAAIGRVSPGRAASLTKDERSGAAALVRLVEDPRRWQPLMGLVITTGVVVQGVLVGVVADRLFGVTGLVVCTAVDAVAVFVSVQVAARGWARNHPERAALVTARPVSVLAALAPLRWLAGALTALTTAVLPGLDRPSEALMSEEELLAVAAEAAEADAIDSDERQLIESIIQFGDTVVREVMVPRPDMITVAQDFRVADVMEVVLLNGFSRVPVAGEGLDDIIGLVFSKDLMRAERDNREGDPVSTLVRSARAVPESKPVAELLREMQAEKFHMAIVIDEYGGTAGLVTLEDLIEELVGEIVDEFDTEDARVEPVPGGGMRVSGSLSIDDANDLLDKRLPEGEFDTVSGLVLAQLGRLAVAGDVVDCETLRLTVERVQGRRIMRVRVDPLTLSDPVEDEDSEVAP